jgi:hypothetical protein
LRAKWAVHPGAPDMAKPKWTSIEVNAAAEWKAILQRQADELEQKKIDTLAEIKLEEELAEEEAESIVVRKQAHADSFNDAEDVIMQSELEDEESKDSKVFESLAYLRKMHN